MHLADQDDFQKKHSKKNVGHNTSQWESAANLHKSRGTVRCGQSAVDYCEAILWVVYANIYFLLFPEWSSVADLPGSVGD